MSCLQRLQTTGKWSVFTPLPAFIALLACCLSPLFAVSNASASEHWRHQPLPSANRNPLVQVHDIPEASGVFTLPKHRIQWSSTFDMASISSQSLGSLPPSANQANESLLLDGETYRVAFKLRYGLSEQSDLSITLPLIAHSGGLADNAISGWHDIFGLPDGNRASRPDNSLDYRYQRNGQNLLEINQSTKGLGDIRFDYRYRINNDSNDDKSNDSNNDINKTGNSQIKSLIQMGIKLPTGNQDRLTGSGATALSTSIQLAQTHMAHAKDWSWHASAGAIWISGGGLLDKIKNDWGFYGSGGISWQATDYLTFKMQLESHTAIYKSKTDELGHATGQLVIGLSAKASPSTVIDLYFTEDVVLHSSPDIGIGLAIHRSISRH